jgi:hypothetical protein
MIIPNKNQLAVRGFACIQSARPNVIAEKHGQVLKGVGGLPVRDELRFQKILYL